MANAHERCAEKLGQAPRIENSEALALSIQGNKADPERGATRSRP